MSEYFVPAGSGEAEFVEKRSSFLGHVRFVETEDAAREFINEMKKKHYDARHNCWCYIIRGGAVRYSDDGEPQGTAGLPMLEVFKREGVENVVCVVTRYFGGVLLGTGGLLRAYTKSAKDALDAAGIAAVRRWVKLEAACPYSLLERMKTECLALEGAVSDVEYGADVRMTFLLPESRSEEFQARVTELSAGQSSAQAVGEELMPVRVK
ncbi:MAG: YigZ family protein [Clostridiales bacterium]|nr:YigZ family protein [Clostridiales bacterium]MDY4144168.1 YigZ family protein [Oscillospiraceae bacterium]